MTTKRFTSKQPYEEYWIDFDFANFLGASEIIASIDMMSAVDEVSLEDVSDTILDATKEVKTDTLVYRGIRGGISGHNYVITCRIIGDQGSKYELEGILPVLETPDAETERSAWVGSKFKTQMQSDLDIFYNVDEFAELIDVESADGEDIIYQIAAVFTFGEGAEYRGDDAPGTNGTVQMRVSDVATVSSGYMIYRDNGEQWRVLGGGRKTSDDLEWIMAVSKYTG